MQMTSSYELVQQKSVAHFRKSWPTMCRVGR